MIIKKLNKDNLKVKVYDNRTNMGIDAANEFSSYIRELLKTKEEINIIFAAAPSQSDFLEALKNINDIEWNRINVFHMDEYVGIGINDNQSFAKFVKNAIVDNFNVKKYFYINGLNKDVDDECLRYKSLLAKYPVDITVLGVGENGHIAFNDPWEADFNDPKVVKKVTLDQKCRQQQVNDKCFDSINDVPLYAYTLTIPTLLKAKAMFCLVPAPTKADAINKIINGGIDVSCPASILRKHDNCTLYLDPDSAKYIL